MRFFWLIGIFCVCIFSSIFGHEGHSYSRVAEPLAADFTIDGKTGNLPELGGRPKTWTEWWGGLHLILLHFPIALLTMTALCELLFYRYRNPMFDYASRFMLIAAAIFSIPTAFFGYIFSYSIPTEGLLADILQWHMWFGIATACLAIVVAGIREAQGRTRLYFILLFLLFILVNLTAALGGSMTFGPYHMLPPA